MQWTGLTCLAAFAGLAFCLLLSDEISPCTRKLGILLVILCIYVSCVVAVNWTESRTTWNTGLWELHRVGGDDFPTVGYPFLAGVLGCIGREGKWAGAHICSVCCSGCAMGCCSKLLLPSFPCGDGPRLEPQAKINALSLKLFLPEQFITTTGSGTQTSCDCSVLQLWTQASPWRNTGWVNDRQDASPCLL